MQESPIVYLAIWNENGLSSPRVAARRFRRILRDRHPVAVSTLHESMREFVLAMRRRDPEVNAHHPDGMASIAEITNFSAQGIILRFDADRSKRMENVLRITHELKLTMYDPKFEFTLGFDDSAEVAVNDIGSADGQQVPRSTAGIVAGSPRRRRPDALRMLRKLHRTTNDTATQPLSDAMPSCLDPNAPPAVDVVEADD
ncbi:hypothetical protein AB0M45_33735 [Nocardia sp. NPDC051787]|uniref:hypothetical protein n=1 Tax=Nocardia sp. NPDC051787 TaxID=3155415 RepID=UPI00342CCD09